MIDVVPGCKCDDCMTRWVADLILYTMKLEKAVLQARVMIDAGQHDMAHGLIGMAVELAQGRNLCGELKLEQQARNLRTAAEMRAMNRLH